LTFQNAILIEAQKHCRTGRFGKAETLCRHLLSSDPSHPDALHLLGMVSIQRGKNVEAIQFIERAIGQNKNAAAYYANLAVALQNLARNEETISASLQALSLNPKSFSAYNTMGNALKELRRWEEAAESFHNALSIKPESPEVYFNIGNVFAEQEKFDQAADCFRRALTLQPDFRRAHFHLGQVLRKMSRLDEAVACYLQSLKFEPDFPEAYFLLGNIYQNQGRLAESIDCYEMAIRLKPDLAEAHKNLGAAYYELGKFDEALVAFEGALRVNPTAGLRIKLATLLPPIVDSVESMEAIRGKFAENVNELLKEEIVLDDPVKELGNPNFFYLAYHGQNDRDLMTRLAKLYRFLPERISSPPIRGPSIKRRVGFISRFFHQHSVGTFFNPMIESLSRQGDFEVTMFSIGDRMDETMPKTAAACHHHIPLPIDLSKARQRISEQSPDILVYTDIGMEPLTYFLAFTRLARVQCVMIGHLMTTGIPNIDYYISSELVEPEGAQDHYSETLVQLKSMPCYMRRPSLPLKPKSRKDFGLPEDCTLYVVPMRLHKIHPDFDPVIAGILRRIPKSEVLLFKDPHNLWHELLLKRFQKTMPDVLERVRFLPWLHDDDFKSLMMLSDVALDTFHYGGGVTSYIILATGTPIVTWPGRHMRGRLTLGCYRKMGVMDCVAESQSRYVDIAIRLGTDRGYRETIKEKISKKNAALYDDEGVVRELCHFFKEMTQ
jgi:predicted O-linked N-acetylglucosamine transferase (SPINDLY family)